LGRSGSERLDERPFIDSSERKWSRFEWIWWDDMIRKIWTKWSNSDIYRIFSPEPLKRYDSDQVSPLKLLFTEWTWGRNRLTVPTDLARITISLERGKGRNDLLTSTDYEIESVTDGYRGEVTWTSRFFDQCRAYKCKITRE
jgi:hypothetical protein